MRDTFFEKSVGAYSSPPRRSSNPRSEVAPEPDGVSTRFSRSGGWPDDADGVEPESRLRGGS